MRGGDTVRRVNTTLSSGAGRLRGQVRDHPDTVGIAGLTVASLLVLWLQPVDPNAGVSRGSDALAVAFVLLTMLPLMWSRRAPLSVAVVAVCASLIGSTRGYALALTSIGAFVGLACAAYFTDRRRTVALGAFTLVALVTISSIAGGSFIGVQPFIVDASGPLLALFAGDVMRTRRLYAERWQARAQEIERLRDADQRRAVADERVRLARDVHDIVGHYLAGIALQARAGLRRVRSDPGRTTVALTEIDHLASEALTETRQAVGIIRSAEALIDLRPAPGIEDIEDPLGSVRVRPHLMRPALPTTVHPAWITMRAPPGTSCAQSRRCAACSFSGCAPPKGSNEERGSHGACLAPARSRPSAAADSRCRSRSARSGSRDVPVRARPSALPLSRGSILIAGTRACVTVSRIGACLGTVRAGAGATRHSRRRAQRGARRTVREG